jgi:hypothetical protein
MISDLDYLYPPDSRVVVSDLDVIPLLLLCGVRRADQEEVGVEIER